MNHLNFNGKIITFYSYKGGVGRSMSLVNIACLMAKQSKKVLLIDWDLEAPGLHSFFGSSINKEDLGLVDFITKAGEIIKIESQNNEKGYLRFFTENAANYISKEVGVEGSNFKIDIIKAGKLGEGYSDKLNAIHWIDFYKIAPTFFRSFAQFLESRYDYILIDARTGLADTSGVCTMLMPQILVLVFALNNQNINGVIEVAKQSAFYRFDSNDHRRLTIYPLPSRIDNENPKELAKWITTYSERFEGMFKELHLLDICNLENYFNLAKIPYKPAYAYGENIPVIDESTDNDFFISYHYNQFLKLLQDDTSIWDILSPQQLEENRKQANIHFQNGYKFSTNNEFEKAIEEFEKSLELNPDNENALSNLGLAFAKLAETKKGIEAELLYKEAFDKYQRAIAIDPDNYDVQDTPFTNPPIEIIKQGNEALRDYFVHRRKNSGELLNEAKLILLGDSRSGKTSFANRLLGKELPKETDRTQGIDIVIGEYSFPATNGQDFKINTWDFAGQDKYKTLHQLFYTESSLYVMVAEAGNTNIDYDDWFQTAALFGGGSPLILVLNEFKPGIGTGSFDTNYWKKQYPELLKEVFTVNLGTKQNLAAVEEYIQFLSQTLPLTKYSFPSNWAAIRKILNERRNERYITLNEYLKICKDNDLPDRESALILSSVLHKVGDCLHYQRSELLKQYVILKNEWAAEAVYKILDDNIVTEKKFGFFDLSDLDRIWNSVEYTDMRPQLLELMKQFKLAYQLPDKTEFVIPSLLPYTVPAGFSWPDLYSLEIYIEYEFLPKALLTQFIVTRNTDIAGGGTLVWRHGAILKWEDKALAEVSKTKLQGRDAFYIRTQGDNRKEMMTAILKTFRELHSEYKGIKYIEKISCTCEGCRNRENKQHYYDFVNLQFRLEKGKYLVECANSLNTINVVELLENIFVFEEFKKGNGLRLKEDVIRENSQGIRVLKFFLASSNELINERKKIELALDKKNDILRKQGFLIELLIWEDGKHIGKSLRSQDYYNLEIEQCDLFVMLFYSKVGKYAAEEFELVKSLFEKKGIPRICVFQKDKDLPKNQSEEEADSRYDFLKRLNEIEHFPILFDTADRLVNELEDVIDKLLEDADFVKELSVD